MVIGFGVAPRVAIGVSADFGVYWPRALLPLGGVSINWGVSWYPPTTGDAPGSTSGARARTSLLFATINPCVHWRRLYGCALLEVGQLEGASESLSLSVQQLTPYVATGGRLGVEAPFAPRLGFRVFGELLATLTSAKILINERPGWTMPSTSGGVGVELYLFLR